MKKSGFTLIELLVVIAIIGLLATLSVLAFQSSRARARDSRRLADIKQFQSALALYEHDAKKYPETSEVDPAISLTHNGVIYMTAIPVPPLPDDGCTGSTIYTYEMQIVPGASTSYTLEYCLGASAAGVPAGLNTATPDGIFLK